MDFTHSTTKMKNNRSVACTVVCWLLFLSSCCGFVWSFVAVSPPRKVSSKTTCRRHNVVKNNRNTGSQQSSSLLRSSSSDNNDGLDAMRQMLEASWNSQIMGLVPKDPKAAAEAAASSLLSAIDDGERLLCVDLLLPAYDITQGTNIYDDVLAVEFCVALTQFLEQTSTILVKDGKTLNSVTRVLEARERDAMERRQQLLDDEGDEEEDDDDDDDYLDSSDNIVSIADNGKEDGPVEYDDFADFDGVGQAASKETPMSGKTEEERAPAASSIKDDSNSKETGDDDVDAFRQQLMASWSSDNDDDATGNDGDSSSLNSQQASEAGEKKTPNEKKKQQSQPPPQQRPLDTISLKKSFRLASLFGNNQISKGADMGRDVVEALKEHALPRDNEDVMVILSAASKEEMMALRSLVAKYDTTKTIVLVNCKFDPIPRELIGVETVYSLLPLIARPTVLETNVFGSDAQQQQEQQETSPKVVVMRRYPGDWEIFVDVEGSGFELAETVRAAGVGQKGPAIQDIVAVVKRHLQTKKFGQ